MSDVLNKRIEFDAEEIENPLTPINPFLIRVREPSQVLHSHNFYVEIAGQELYRWSKVEGRYPFLFEALQESLRQVGYGLEKSAKTRIQNVLSTKIHRLAKWVLSVKNWKTIEERKCKWVEIEILESEMIKTPRDIVVENEVLEECNDEILAELYDSMEETALLRERCALNSERCGIMAHHGKLYHEVSRKQQQRDISQICARAKRALWFAETFGLLPTKLVMKDKLANEVEIQLQEKVWKGKDGKHDWMSLMGNDKKKLLRQLPEHFPQVLKPETCETVTKLWKDFKSLFEVFTSERPSDAQIKEFHQMALQWARHLVSMNRMAGYQQTRQITPYIHILVHHAIDVLEKYKTLKIFSGQGVEKKNDDFRRYFMRKSNRWDACASLLRVEKRQETLTENRRNARKYRKMNEEFWTGGGKEMVAAQIPRPCIGRDDP